jgi:F-type H+-transporting ATPase subunit b
MGLIDVDATIFVQLVLFLIFMIALTKLIFKPYMAMLAERENKTTGLHNQTKEITAQIGELVRQHDMKINQARQEAIALRNGIREDGLRMKERLLKEVEAESQMLYKKQMEQMQKVKMEFDEKMDEYALMLSNEIVQSLITHENKETGK